MELGLDLILFLLEFKTKPSTQETISLQLLLIFISLFLYLIILLNIDLLIKSLRHLHTFELLVFILMKKSFYIFKTHKNNFKGKKS